MTIKDILWDLEECGLEVLHHKKHRYDKAHTLYLGSKVWLRIREDHFSLLYEKKRISIHSCWTGRLSWPKDKDNSIRINVSKFETVTSESCKSRIDKSDWPFVLRSLRRMLA